MNIIFANRDNIELMRLLLLMIYSLFDVRVNVINVNFVLLVVFYSCVCIGVKSKLREKLETLLFRRYFYYRDCFN